MPIDDRYRSLCHVARLAGRIALDFWNARGTLAIEEKGPRDFVTRADRDVESFIRREFAERYPDDGFLGEETVASFTRRGEALWIVDPIDGTHNFLRGIPYWNVSIAWIENGVRMLGAVYDPVHDELFHAMRGHGAWCSRGGKDVRLATRTPTHLAGAMVAIGHSDRYTDARYVYLRRASMDAGCTFRNFGAAALQLAHVADGRLDGYVELEVSAWDAMAGLLLVEEAGGYVAPFPGAAGLTAMSTAIATAPGIAAAITGLVDASLASGPAPVR